VAGTARRTAHSAHRWPGRRPFGAAVSWSVQPARKRRGGSNGHPPAPTTLASRVACGPRTDPDYLKRARDRKLPNDNSSDHGFASDAKAESASSVAGSITGLRLNLGIRITTIVLVHVEARFIMGCGATAAAAGCRYHMAESSPKGGTSSMRRIPVETSLRGEKVCLKAEISVRLERRLS
jgi:hypothetical protein